MVNISPSRFLHSNVWLSVDLCLCVKGLSNCLSARSKCQLIINSLRASESVPSGRIGCATLSKEEQSRSVIHPVHWLIGSGDEGPVSQGVYVGQRAEQIAVTRPRHFPHSELKISLKSLFFVNKTP